MRSLAFGSPRSSCKVEEVVIEKREHILGEVGRLDSDRGKVRRLLKPRHEPGAVGHALDLRHPARLPDARWRASERSCGRLLPEDFTRRASELFAGTLDRRLDDEVARVRGARDTRFPLERRLDRHGVLVAYGQLAGEDEPAEYPGARRARYLVEECRHDPAVRHPRRAVIGFGDRVLADDPVASSPEAHPQPVRAGGPAAALGKDKLVVLGLGHRDAELFPGPWADATGALLRRGVPRVNLRRLRTTASSSVVKSRRARS